MPNIYLILTLCHFTSFYCRQFCLIASSGSSVMVWSSQFQFAMCGSCIWGHLGGALHMCFGRLNCCCSVRPHNILQARLKFYSFQAQLDLKQIVFYGKKEKKRNKEKEARKLQRFCLIQPSNFIQIFTIYTLVMWNQELCVPKEIIDVCMFQSTASAICPQTGFKSDSGCFSYFHQLVKFSMQVEQ